MFLDVGEGERFADPISVARIKLLSTVSQQTAARGKNYTLSHSSTQSLIPIPTHPHKMLPEQMSIHV